MFHSTFYVLIPLDGSSFHLCPSVVQNTILLLPNQAQIPPVEIQSDQVVQNSRPQPQPQQNRPKPRRYPCIIRRNNDDEESYVEQKRQYCRKRYQIKRVFCCSAEACEKRYGSLIAQRNHQRNAHGIRRRITKTQA